MPTSLLAKRPNSPDAERTTIGALLVDPERIVDVIAHIEPKDFHDPTYRTIYQTIRTMYEDRKPIDFVTVAEALRGNAKLDGIGGAAFLATLANAVPTAAHASHYAAIVRDKSMHRQLLDAGMLIAELAQDESLSGMEALERAEQKLLGIARHAASVQGKNVAFQMEHGLDLLVIDYLQLIEVTDRAAGENRTQQVSHVSRSLKNLARELGAPVIALSQLSRSTEQRNPPIPILSDLRDSGGIEQDADVVLMLYREELHNEDCEHPGETDVFVRKNRNGPTGRVSLYFDKAKMSFRNVDHIHSGH